MMIEPRPYRDAADLESMEAILVAGRKADKSSFYVHVGDLRLWLYYTLPEDQPWSRIYLWEAEQGEVVAWTMFSIADEAFDLFVMPELHGKPEMYSMLAWSADRMSEILRQAGVSTVNKMWNHPEDSALRHALEQSGFSISGDASAHMVCPLDKPIPGAALPDGYLARSCRGVEEVELRAAAQHAAFESSIAFDQYVERFLRFMRSPVYDPQQDIVVTAPDGRIVSFCKLWLDSVNRIGNFEPVGTHPDFQRRGLGRAVMLEGLRRLQAWKMTRAILGTGIKNEPAIRLYEQVGFHVETQLLTYARAI
jgi:ribosomal protein S18 acetylase RimI-like enzyme